MLIIPAIDLREGKCVRLTQGRREDVKVYDGDPVEIARGFEDAGARMIHVVDLDGAFADRNAVNRKVVRRIIRAVKIPVQFGGGLRALTDVQQMIEYGAAQVVVGTLAAESPETLEKFVQLFGFRVCVGIDARDGMLSGVNLEQTCAIARESGLRVTASGGVSSLEDIRALKSIS
ncbi:MAG TPA: HisA/HisF-related TIM barrel protein, partial [Pyrinomonadaceae bacterium]|nr:HisA/HisF-related TIM barrel protein [Pyrinomonadaceae bacterium]